MSDPLVTAQRLLDDSVAAERERVAKEREGMRVRGPVRLPEGTRLELPPRPELPPDVTPLDLTPRPDGLSVDVSIGSYALKRLSPFRRRWPEVHEFDARVARLEQKQADVNAELAGLQEQLVQAEAADRETLARWVATQEEERPLPTAPALEQRISELTAEREALTTAVQHTLDEKTAYVEKHRGRLKREAKRALKQAARGFDEAITQAEQTRAELAECVKALRWATTFPSEQADAGDLKLELAKGGYVPKAIPDHKTLTAMVSVFAWLREDCDWVATVLDPKPEDDEPDVRKGAVWEQTDEGRQAINRENKRIVEGLAPKDAREAKWQ
jgi:hypothetical protein